MNKILRLNDVIAKTGLSRSSIYLYMNNGTFPQSRPIGMRSIGWLEADVEAWIIEKYSVQ